MSGTAFLADFINRQKDISNYQVLDKPKLYVEKCMLFLASVCDYATTRDDRGHGKSTVEKGHKVAAKLMGKYALSEDERKFSLSCVTLYQGQLRVKFHDEGFDKFFQRPIFITTPLSDEKAYQPLVMYKNHSAQCEILLPKLSKWPDQKAMKDDLFSIQAETRVHFLHGSGKSHRWWDFNWKEPTLGFYLSDDGAPKLISLLRDRGFAIDKRIDRVMASPYKSMLWVDKWEYDTEKKKTGLFAFVKSTDYQEDRPDKLKSLVDSFGVDGLFVRWDKRRRAFAFPVHEAVIENVIEFCVENQVVINDDIRDLVSKPSLSKYAHPGFKKLSAFKM
jgi:hypothetical protein